jgi:hypothetical protein
MVVFESTWKFIVFGCAAWAPEFSDTLDFGSDPTVSVKEDFSIEVIFPETDCAAAGV